MRLRDANPNTANHNRPSLNGLFSKQRMDAHDIANRIMRKDNYFIAMINRDVLDLTVPVPILNTRPLLTKILEWNINLCIMKYVFDDQGQVRSAFIKDAHKRLLADGWGHLVSYQLMADWNVGSSLRGSWTWSSLPLSSCISFSFISSGTSRFYLLCNNADDKEYHKNPGALGSRQYKPFAQWKFREFNELYHIFKKRLDFSHKFASKYIDQFPKEKTAQISRYYTQTLF
jgi:autophagy-related protein 9